MTVSQSLWMSVGLARLLPSGTEELGITEGLLNDMGREVTGAQQNMGVRLDEKWSKKERIFKGGEVEGEGRLVQRRHRNFGQELGRDAKSFQMMRKWRSSK